MIPKANPDWIQWHDRYQALTCISEATPSMTHWDTEVNRSRRCGGKECYLCAIGVQRQLRVYVLALTKDNKEVLFELRERHRDVFDGFGSLVGLQIRGRKIGLARNSPVEIVCGEFVYAVRRDITRLVDCLGLPPILCRKDRDDSILPYQPERENLGDPQLHPGSG